MKKQEYEAKRKLSTDTLEPVIITNKPEPKTPTPNQQLETSFICEDDTEFWENMTQMQVNYMFISFSSSNNQFSEFRISNIYNEIFVLIFFNDSETKF